MAIALRYEAKAASANMIVGDVHLVVIDCKCMQCRRTCELIMRLCAQDLIVSGGAWIKNILRAHDAHVYVSGGAAVASGIADAIARHAG